MSGILKLRRWLKRKMLRAVRHERWCPVLAQQEDVLPVPYNVDTSAQDLVQAALGYVERQRVVDGKGRLLGYRYAASRHRPTVYGTVAAVLLKDLVGQSDERLSEELALIEKCQQEDGLFLDPVIACPEAEQEDWWGWRHLTLHCVMALATHGRVARYEPQWVLRCVRNADDFRSFIRGRNWGTRVANTSNELQNIGVALQYARDWQGCAWAGELVDVLLDEIDEHQDPATGLYGHSFNTPDLLSQGVQAGYHFWLLHCYDRRAVPYADRIVYNVLRTQSVTGGFGVSWRSSACEDIDSIDPLYRFSLLAPRMEAQVQISLRLALAAVLGNANADGGWVFRRGTPFRYGWSPQTESLRDESSVFFTWFRMLGLAFCLQALKDLPRGWKYPWNLKRIPGLQQV